MKNQVDKLDIGELETTSLDLSKPTNLVKSKVFQKTEYDESVKKLNVI